MHICFSSHCIVLFPMRTPASWRSAKCTRRLFKVWRNWPNSKLICYSERGEPRLSFEYKLSATLENFKNYTQPYMHRPICFSSMYYYFENTGKLKQCEVHTGSLRYVLYCYFEIPLNIKTLENFKNYTKPYMASWRSWSSAKCTRRLFKVWSNWPNSKLICYSQRGEPRLSFEYKFIGHPWKFQKLYPTVHAYLFFFTLYCIISTENTGKLKECEVHTEAL